MKAKATIPGKVTSEPTIQHVGLNQDALTKFSVVVSEKRKGVERNSFFDVSAWRGTAEILHKYLKKGDYVTLFCDMEQQKWDDKTTGKERTRIEFTVREFAFMGKGPNHGKAPYNPEDDFVKTAEGKPVEAPAQSTVFPGAPADDDEIPF